jgi:hypothetical protein
MYIQDHQEYGHEEQEDLTSNSESGLTKPVDQTQGS